MLVEWWRIIDFVISSSARCRENSCRAPNIKFVVVGKYMRFMVRRKVFRYTRLLRYIREEAIQRSVIPVRFSYNLLNMVRCVVILHLLTNIVFNIYYYYLNTYVLGEGKRRRRTENVRKALHVI